MYIYIWAIYIYIDINHYERIDSDRSTTFLLVKHSRPHVGQL